MKIFPLASLLTKLVKPTRRVSALHCSQNETERDKLPRLVSSYSFWIIKKLSLIFLKLNLKWCLKGASLAFRLIRRLIFFYFSENMAIWVVVSWTHRKLGICYQSTLMSHLEHAFPMRKHTNVLWSVFWSWFFLESIHWIGSISKSKMYSVAFKAIAN